QLLLIAGYALANLVEIIAAAAMIRVLKMRTAVTDSLRDLFPFVVPIAMCSSALSATVAAIVVALAQGPDLVWHSWRSWWIADRVGTLTVPPLLTPWLRDPLPPRLSWPRAAEAAGLVATLLVSGYAAFGGVAALDSWQPVTPLLAMPGLLWA